MNSIINDRKNKKNEIIKQTAITITHPSILKTPYLKIKHRSSTSKLETTFIEWKTIDDRFTESNLGFQGKRNSQKGILRESFAFYSRHRLKIIPRLQKEGTTMKSVEPTGRIPDIIQSTIGGLSAAWQSRLVNSFQHANGSAGVATRAPRAFVLRFFEPLSPLNAHNALIPSVSLARCGKERKKREEWRFNGELRRRVISVDWRIWGWCWSFSWIMKWFWKFVCINV